MSISTSNLPRTMRRQFGVTLVELMVGLVIGIIVSLAASALYLATRESSRAAQGHSDINETGKIALDMIGRELQKAGFYPAQYPTPTDVSRSGRYYNPTTAPVIAAFNYGLFGCDNKKWDPAMHACATGTTKGDTVVINYFSSPEFGTSSLLGSTNDCNRKPVSGYSVNAPLAAASMPLFVSNRFGLTATTYTDAEGKLISTYSLSCQGVGADSAPAQEAIQGLDELVIRYGLGTDAATQSPSKFMSATDVAGAGTSSDGLAPWQRVTAVKVCIVVRSLQNNRLEDKTGSVRTYNNCSGGTSTPAAGDKYLYKSFERIFAIRNNLSAVGTF